MSTHTTTDCIPSTTSHLTCAYCFPIDGAFLRLLYLISYVGSCLPFLLSVEEGGKDGGKEGKREGEREAKRVMKPQDQEAYSILYQI